MTPIDGYTEQEYQLRYDTALRFRGAGGNVLSATEMNSLILDLLSRPRSDLLNADYTKLTEHEAVRDYLDLADWIELLHKVTYKPGWRVWIEPIQDVSGRLDRFELRCETMANLGWRTERVGSCIHLIPRMHGGPVHAMEMVSRLIYQVERAITDATLCYDGRPWA